MILNFNNSVFLIIGASSLSQCEKKKIHPIAITSANLKPPTFWSVLSSGEGFIVFTYHTLINTL